jgi:hypothetical protein
MRLTISKDGTADLILDDGAIGWGEGTLTHADRLEVEGVLHRYGDDDSAWMKLDYSNLEESPSDDAAERHRQLERWTPIWGALIALFELPQLGYRVIVAEGQAKPPNRAHRGG